MPILDNPRHEAFARGLAEGLSLVDAYERAGFKRHDGNSARLRGDERIQGRVQELQQEAAQKTGYTLETISQKLERGLKMAEELGAPAAYMTGCMGLAKLHGLLIDKTEVSGSLDIGSALQAARRRARMRNTSDDMSDETDGK